MSEPGESVLVFEDDFDAPTLDESAWLPAYLPQWSSRAASQPRYRIEQGNLVLTIEPDQPPWCPEFNGSVRVSNLQTGVRAGALGSAEGQHRFSPHCRVREEQEPQRLFTPTYGVFELRARCRIGSSNVAAFWLIGFEESPAQSAEICVFELKGTNVREGSAVIGYGIHPFDDPTLSESFVEEEFAVDVTDYHVYSAQWAPGRVRFQIDGVPVRTIEQAPDYPMQLMLNLYDLADQPDASRPPAEFWIDYVRVWSPDHG